MSNKHKNQKALSTALQSAIQPAQPATQPASNSASLTLEVSRQPLDVLKDFEISNGFIALKNGRNLPSVDEAEQVIRFEAVQAGSAIEIGANMLRFAQSKMADVLIPQYVTKNGVEVKDDQGKSIPVLSADGNHICAQRKAYDVLIDRLSDALNNGSLIRDMQNLMPILAFKEKLIAHNLCAVDVPYGTVKNAKASLESFIVGEEKDKDGKVKLITLDAAADVFRAFRDGTVRGNTVVNLLDDAKIEADRASVLKGASPKFEVSKKASDRHTLAIAEAKLERLADPKTKENAVKLSEVEKKAVVTSIAAKPEIARSKAEQVFVKENAPLFAEKAQQKATEGESEADKATREAKEAADAARKGDTFAAFWERTFKAVEACNVNFDAVSKGGAEYQAATNEAESAIVALLQKCRQGKQLSVTWTDKASK